MKEFFPVIHTAALFSGISDEELAAMLSCLGARIDTFPKGSRLLRAGEAVEEVGLVLAGSVLIVQEDIWGNRNILSKTIFVIGQKTIVAPFFISAYVQCL